VTNLRCAVSLNDQLRYSFASLDPIRLVRMVEQFHIDNGMALRRLCIQKIPVIGWNLCHFSNATPNVYTPNPMQPTLDERKAHYNQTMDVEMHYYCLI
jgi:hypothetical protein